MKNALEAVQEKQDRQIFLQAYLDERSRAHIDVEDNGEEMTAEAQGKIFIPFFTPKVQAPALV